MKCINGLKCIKKSRCILAIWKLCKLEYFYHWTNGNSGGLFTLTYYKNPLESAWICLRRTWSKIKKFHLSPLKFLKVRRTKTDSARIPEKSGLSKNSGGLSRSCAWGRLRRIILADSDGLGQNYCKEFLSPHEPAGLSNGLGSVLLKGMRGFCPRRWGFCQSINELGKPWCRLHLARFLFAQMEASHVLI